MYVCTQTHKDPPRHKLTSSYALGGNFPWDFAFSPYPDNSQILAIAIKIHCMAKPENCLILVLFAHRLGFESPFFHQSAQKP